MGSVTHVGRIGALAVALGIGVAVAGTSPIAHAEPSDAGSSSASGDSSSTSTSSSTDTSSADGAASSDRSERTGSSASGPASSPGVADAASKSDVDSAGSPDAAVADDVDDVDEQEPTGVGDQDARRPAGDRQTQPTADSGQKVDSVDVDTADHGDSRNGGAPGLAPLDAADDADQIDADGTGESSRSGGQTLSIAVVGQEPETAPSVGDVTAGAFTPLSAAALLDEPPPKDPERVPEDVYAHPVGGLAQLVEAVVEGVLAPFGPHSPLHSPLLWAVLASVRDEVERVLNPTGTVASHQAASATAPMAAVQLVPPDITDPSTWLPFVGSLAYDLTVLVDRMFHIYDFSDPRGWVAFVLDYTWALPTTLTGLETHVVNIFFWPTDPKYRYDLSYHQNRAVYEGGNPGLGALFLINPAVTSGNVISNAGHGTSFVSRFTMIHEDVHVWQNRLFGPLMLATYGAWLAGGAVFAAAVWLTDPSQDLLRLVNTLAYYDNPWEYWAYNVEDDWPPSPFVADPRWLWP